MDVSISLSASSVAPTTWRIQESYTHYPQWSKSKR